MTIIVEERDPTQTSFQQAGRVDPKPPISIMQARSEAQALLAGGNYSELLFRLVDYLYVGGVMSTAQIGVTPRTMRKYAQLRVVDRLQFTSSVVSERLIQLGLVEAPDPSHLLYALGPVGIEIAKMRHTAPPASGFLAFPLERLLHDVIMNEIVLRISSLATRHGWQATWASKYEATLVNKDHQILEPDAMLRLEKDDQEHLYLFEYHNEGKSTRALGKVRRYEAAHHSRVWRETWQTDEFPKVLAVFRKQIVARGYQEGIDERAVQNVFFYGRTLSGFLATSRDLV